MLLTLKQSAHPGFKSFHDYSPSAPPSTSHFSPVLTNGGSSLPSLPPATKSTNKSMSTPHRGLPPPVGLALPQPTQASSQLGQSSTLSQPMGQLPAPPQQWQGAEESMRNWLRAKAEEDKRKQEEEKTRQEGLRLEQRKVEHDMLRTSLSGGIPPHMIPMVFAGMGGANLANVSLEWTQQYMAQAHQQQQLLQQQQQQQQAVVQHPNTSPELRRDPRQSSHLQGASQHPLPAPLPSTPMGTLGSQQPTGYVPSYPMSPSKTGGPLPGPSALSRLPQSSELPRINTGEMQTQQPPQGPPSMQGMHGIIGQQSHPLQQSQSANPPPQESQSSTGIYFHYWQPPTSQAGASGPNQPSTPSDVPSSSPKKRKAQGPQHAAPAPSQTQHTSPYSLGGSSASGTPAGRRRGHSRQRSDLSSRALDSYGRPGSRHRHSESVISTQSGASPTQQPGFDAAAIGTPTGQTRSQRTSTSERSDTRQSIQERSFSFGSEVRQEDRIPVEQDSTSSRTSGKREEMRD